MKLPPETSKDQDYNLWKKDVDIWAKLTDTPEAKRGRALQFACRSNKKLHEAVLKVEDEKVDCADGLKNVIEELDKIYNIDKKETAIQCYQDFLSLKRKPNQKIADFLFEFENLAEKTQKNGNKLSDDLLAFRLLQALNLSETDERIIKSSVTELTVKNITEVLKRSYGESTYTTTYIKPEPLFYAKDSSEEKVSDDDDNIFYGASNWKKKKA